MKSPIKLLSLVVRATVLLLTGSAVLVVLSIFNASLHWDIFSPAAEKILYGIFGSFVALGGFGAAISLVLGIQEVVTSFRRLVDRAHPESAPAAVEAPRKSYLVVLAAVLVLLVVTISGFGLANRRITAHRIEVFKLIAQDQMEQLGPRLAAEVAGIQKPCNSCGTETMAELFDTMTGLSFVSDATLYLPDPADDTVLWRYPADGLYSVRDASHQSKMARFFIAKDDDRAVKLALQGDPAWINQKNGGGGFTWYHVVKDAQGHNRGVLVIEGKPSESFRDYAAGAAAQKKRARGR
jgi:hypothetical protein